MKNTKETRKYFIKKTDQYESMSNKQKKVCATLHYIEHLLTFVPAAIACVFISGFSSLARITTGITNSSIR